MPLYVIFKDSTGTGRAIETAGKKKGFEEINNWALKEEIDLTGDTIVFTHTVARNVQEALQAVNVPSCWDGLNKREYTFK